jgi:translation elongation factor EF-G
MLVSQFMTFRELVTSGGRINPALLSACASSALSGALRKAGAHLLEPIMQMEIDVFDSGQSTAHSSIIHELAKRRATILGAQEEDLSSEFKSYLVKVICLFSSYEENSSDAAIIRVNGSFDRHSQGFLWSGQFPHGSQWLSTCLS